MGGHLRGGKRDSGNLGKCDSGIWDLVGSGALEFCRSNFAGMHRRQNLLGHYQICLARLVVRAGVELDARRERLEHAPGRCAACGEVFASPMHMHQFGFRYGPAYGVQRRLYAHETATPHPARAPVYRQEPPVADAVLARLGHFYWRS